MTEQEREDVLYRSEEEGFDYCFMCYSDFKEIEDPIFHLLREEYQNAHKRLKFYLENGFDAHYLTDKTSL